MNATNIKRLGLGILLAGWLVLSIGMLFIFGIGGLFVTIGVPILIAGVGITLYALEMPKEEKKP